MIKVNGKEIIFDKFPNNETLFKKQIDNIKENVLVTFKYEDDSDLIKLLLVKKEIDKFCPEFYCLEIMYMPYSRMDRDGGDMVFTLKYISEFINNLNFDSVVIYESHSNVCLDLINNGIDKYFTPMLLDGVKEKYDYILLPDAGSCERYQDMFNANIIYANKERDFNTGKILNLEIVGDIKEGSDVVIVDDLSSFGGTFLWAASKLKERGVNNIYLVIGHAEKSILQGKIPESDLIKRVYTTNSIIDKNQETDKIKIKEVV